MNDMHSRVAECVAKVECRHARLKKSWCGPIVAPATVVIGWLLLIVGLVTIPLPGPGWLTVFVAVGVLSLEVSWAHRLLHWGIRQYEAFFRWYHRQNAPIRYALIALTVVVIWVIFAAIGFGMWKAGWLSMLPFG